MKKRFLSLLLCISMVSALVNIPVIANAEELQEGIFKYYVTDGAATISGCTDITGDIVIPSTVGGYPVEKVSNISNAYSWEVCETLTSVTISEGIKEIADGTFRYSVNLKSVSFPQTLVSIGAEAFIGCSGLEEVNFPDSLTEIGKSAFKDCSGITKAEFGASLEAIGDYAFENCIGIPTIKFNDGLTNIGNYAFLSCSGLTEAVLPDTVTSMGVRAFQKCTALTKINYPAGLNDGNYIFEGCTSLSEITVPEGITAIPVAAFAGAEALKTVNLPTTLTVIGEQAFRKCTGLEEIVLPDSVTTIDTDAFRLCKNLKSINYPLSLKSMGKDVFNGCTSLKSFAVPEGVTTLPDYMFYNAKSLETVTLPTTLKTIGYAAFYYCESMEGITLPDSVETIEGSAFWYCSSLSSINYPMSWKSASTKIFSGCTALTSITVPEGVTDIPAYAFSSVGSLKNVKLPDTLKSIGKQALYYCTGLDELILPEGLETIGTNALAGLKCTIYCAESSLAITQLIDKGIDFKMSDITSYENFEYTGTDYYSVSNDGNVGYMSFVMTYKVKDGLDISDKKVTIRFPESAEFLENTIELNGITVTDYSLSKNILKVPVTDNEGEISFCIKPGNYNDLLTYAKMDFKKDSESVTEIIGVINASVPSVTINADDRTGADFIKVNGIAPPSSDVDLYVGDDLISTVKSKKSGIYSAQLPITNPESYKNYTVTAKTINNNEEYSASKKVMYEAELPELEKLVMIYKGKYYDLTKSSPVVQYTSQNSLQYSVKFKNSEQIEDVYIVSTRNNKKRYMNAVWDEENQSFITEGAFEGTSFGYVPGKITVEYTKKRKDVPISDKIDTKDLAEYMNPAVKDCVTEIKTNTDTEYAATINIADELSSLIGDEIDFTVKTTLKEYSESSIYDLMETGENIYSYFIDKDSDKYVLNLEFTDDEINMIVHDISGNKQLNYAITAFAEYAEADNPDLAKKALGASTLLSGINLVTGTLSDVYDIENADEELHKKIMAAGMTAEEREIALKKAKELKNDREMFLLMTLIITTATAGAVGAPAVAFGLLFGAVTTTSDFFWDMRMANILGTNISYSVKWQIDPSGYVYEDVESNRLEGVTTTAYWIEPDYIDDNGVGDVSKAVIWDADEYE